MKGKIQQRTVKAGSTNGKDWLLYCYKINDIVYSTFDDKFKDFAENQTVEFEFEDRKGKLNLTSMKLADNVTPESQKATLEAETLTDIKKLLILCSKVLETKYGA